MPNAATPQKVRGVYEHPKKSGIWWIHYYVQGVRRRERVGTHANAVRLYQKRKTQVLLDEKLPELNRRKTTFGELLDCAIAFANEHNKTASQYVQRAEMLRPAFGKRTAADIKPEEFAAWIRKRNVGPASFNRIRAFISLAFREGIRNGKIEVNTARLIPQKREPRGRQRFLDYEEYEEVLAIIRSQCPDQEAPFSVSVFTGMRLAEQYGLRWKHVDLKRRELRLEDTKNGETRTIPMNSVVFAHVSALHALGHSSNSPVFARKLGGAGRMKQRWFESVIRKAGIEDYTWHNNRHTFCSWHAMAGTPIKTLQELAGHKTIAITARYMHLAPSHRAAEQERIVPGAGPALVPFPTATRTAIREIHKLDSLSGSPQKI